jgi:hypothetical protein
MTESYDISTPEGPKRVTRVGVESADEKPTTLNLDDGSVLKVRLVTMKVARIEGEWDAEGHPRYLVSNQAIIVVEKSPDSLKRGGR